MTTLFEENRYLALEYAAARLDLAPGGTVGDLHRRWRDSDQPLDACRVLVAQAAGPAELVLQLRVVLSYVVDEFPEEDSFAGFALECILTALAAKEPA